MFFEGDADSMLKAMDTVRGLPDDTKLFVGHEYTMTNLEFCNKTEGASNPKIGEFCEKYNAQI
jgi:hydroxyacylglutathione hydrolase